MKRIAGLCAALLILCGCALTAPDVYKAGGLTLPAITDVNGGEKRLLRAELVRETDPVRAAIYSEEKRYTYDAISDDERARYFERLKAQGCVAVSESCMQSAVNADGAFIEVTVSGNTVTIARGTL